MQCDAVLPLQLCGCGVVGSARVVMRPASCEGPHGFLRVQRKFFMHHHQPAGLSKLSMAVKMRGIAFSPVAAGRACA
jgi:hypothetical protein